MYLLIVYPYCYVCFREDVSHNDDNELRRVMTAGDDELNSDQIDSVLEILREQYGHEIAGLQPTVIGQYVQGKSVPQFEAAGKKKFVQILNVGDHWLTVTNKNTASKHVVTVYDSLYTTPSHTMVVQVSALLRYCPPTDINNDCAEQEPDEIEFRFVPFQRQPEQSRMCGYYAIASAVSCVLGADPSRTLYDETLLRSHYETIVTTADVRLFPSCVYEPPKSTVYTHKRRMLHCLCQRESEYSQEMIQCSRCYFWFHIHKCVEAPGSPGTLKRSDWYGPCCGRRMK